MLHAKFKELKIRTDKQTIENNLNRVFTSLEKDKSPEWGSLLTQVSANAKKLLTFDAILDKFNEKTRSNRA